MLFAHAGHSHGGEMCCFGIALGIAVLALVLAVVAIIISLKKGKK